MAGAEVNFISALIGTPLEAVYDAFTKDDFYPAPEDPVAEDDVVIGELSPLEKALMTARNRIADANNAMVREVEAKGEEPNKLEVRKNKKTCDALNSIFWACVQHRFGAPAYEADGNGLRERYKVVSLSLPRDPFLRMLAVRLR